MSTNLLFEISLASLETLYMVLASGACATLLGIPLGIVLFVTQHPHLYYQPFLSRLLGMGVNITRSIPFIILMVMCTPITRYLIGTSIGTTAAIIPLSLAAIPFMARLTENTLSKVGAGLIEAGLNMSATTYQIVRYILLIETLPHLIQNISVMLINLVTYSAMAGAVGGGGLGDLAIRYGYHRFDTRIMLITTLLLVGFVQIIQYIGEYVSAKLKKTD
jgi:ABC-type methionine transport system permease subunit